MPNWRCTLCILHQSGLVLQAGVQHLVFSGLMDPRPFKPALPVDPTSGCQIPHYETKAQIKVTLLTKCCLASAVACTTAVILHCMHCRA